MLISLLPFSCHLTCHLNPRGFWETGANCPLIARESLETETFIYNLPQQIQTFEGMSLKFKYVCGTNKQLTIATTAAHHHPSFQESGQDWLISYWLMIYRIYD